ncbi:MAG: four helix bundle protein [Bacteroidales bacterium]|jgi:four helix bundle protein|nr:four helix bundle protein [Bacteroidales bacterium]
MENKEFSRKLEKRTKAFAIGIIKLSGLLTNSVEGKVIRNQMTKSGTSIGANYREAVRARSRADFKSKIKICESEASETCYWLEIVKDLQWIENEKLKGIIIEADELLAIFASIGKNLNSQA